MYPVSAAFLRALTAAHHVVVDVAYSNDRGHSWTPVDVVSGSVTADRTSQTRWSCSLTLGPDTDTELGGVTPYGTRLRVRRGIRPLRSDPMYVPVGVYRVTSVSRGSDTTIAVAGASMEQQVTDSRYLTPQSLGGDAGDSAATIVSQLIKAAVPDATLDWRVDGSQLVPQIHQSTDRWAVIDGGTDDGSIARALGAEIYCDGSGTFIVAPTPTLSDVPVWDVRYGQALVSASTEWTRGGVYNVVVATGESTDADKPPVGPGIAWDDDPGSPTYAGPDPVNHPELAGAFGVIPRFYTSPLLTSTEACYTAAQSVIADALGLHRSVSFDSLVNPALEPGDVVRVETQPGRVENHLLDSVSWDLTSPAMSCATRATTTRLLGYGGVLVTGETGDISVPAPEAEAAP